MSFVFCTGLGFGYVGEYDTMPTLNHVSMLTKNGWKRVTAEEVSAYSTVSARSGIFYCELCGQYVTFASGPEKGRYFRHNSEEADKNCPERIISANTYSPSFSPRKYELPVRIIVNNKNSFRFELGLIPVPREVIDQESSKFFVIKASDLEFRYSFERLNREMVTFFPVGNYPPLPYSLQVSERLSRFWPNNKNGFLDDLLLFDAKTGIMVRYNSDICVGQKYYMFTSNNSMDRILNKMGISCEMKSSLHENDYYNWYVYEIEILKFSKKTALFFLNHHYILTDKPLSVYPLWPVHVRTPYLIKHNESEMIFHVSGKSDVKMQTFPKAEVKSIEQSDHLGKVVKIDLNERQQIVAAGIVDVLEYVYYWKDDLLTPVNKPEVIVKEANGTVIKQGTLNRLPSRKTITITASVDGVVLLKNGEDLTKKINLKSGKRLEINNVFYGMSISILQGLDTVWEGTFLREYRNQKTDNDIYNRLSSFKDTFVPVGHDIRFIIMKMNDYPKTKEWLKSAAKKGFISNNALKYIKKFIIKQINGEKCDERLY